MRDDGDMRTTLDLDEDVLQAAKELADVNRCDHWKDGFPNLARESTRRRAGRRRGPQRRAVAATLDRASRIVTMKLVNELKR